MDEAGAEVADAEGAEASTGASDGAGGALERNSRIATRTAASPNESATHFFIAHDLGRALYVGRTRVDGEFGDIDAGIWMARAPRWLLAVWRWSDIANLNQSFVERDPRVENLNQSFVERDPRVEKLNQTRLERDPRIGKLDLRRVERDPR